MSTVLAPPGLRQIGLHWEGRGGDVLLRTLVARLKRRNGAIKQGVRAVSLRMIDDQCVGVEAVENTVSCSFDAKTVVLAAPKEGVVKQLIFSKTAAGAPVKSFPGGTKRVYVRLVFSARPKQGPLKVLWAQPDGSAVITIKKRIADVVTTFIASNRPFKRGKWHAIVTAHGVRVAYVAVKIV